MSSDDEQDEAILFERAKEFPNKFSYSTDQVSKLISTYHELDEKKTLLLQRKAFWN